jgi:hypothetical protein
LETGQETNQATSVVREVSRKGTGSSSLKCEGEIREEEALCLEVTDGGTGEMLRRFELLRQGRFSRFQFGEIVQN